MFAVCFIVCRVLSIGHTAKKHLAVCTHGKNITHDSVMLYRVFYLGTQQSKKKISSHHETFSTLHIQHMVLHVKI